MIVLAILALAVLAVDAFIGLLVLRAILSTR